MVKVRIVPRGQISGYEARKAKREEDSLLIGTTDKSLSLVSAGSLIRLNESPTLTRPGNNYGYLTIPTVEGIPFILQYGSVQATVANAVIDVPLHVPYTNRIFQVQLTHSNGGTHTATGYRYEIVDNANIRIYITGGGNDYFAWQTIGF